MFISSLLPIGPLTYTHFFLLKKYQGKIKTDVVSTEAGYGPFCPRGEPPVLLRREDTLGPGEVRSRVKNQALCTQRPLPRARGRCPTPWGVSVIPHHPGKQMRLGDSMETKRPPFLVNNPRQGCFPMRTPAYISGKSNKKIKCSVTMNIHLLLSIFFPNTGKTLPLKNIHKINRYHEWVATASKYTIEEKEFLFQ